MRYAEPNAWPSNGLRSSLHYIAQSGFPLTDTVGYDNSEFEKHLNCVAIGHYSVDGAELSRTIAMHQDKNETLYVGTNDTQSGNWQAA